jgi:hypothetical protein
MFELPIQYHEHVEWPARECMIVALAGRRIDATDAESSSFPLANIERVRQDLRRLFARLRPEALVSSAACGADLLALDEAGAAGIRRRVVLPFNARRFLETSVLDRPGEWRSVYESVIRDVTAKGDLVVLDSNSEGEEPYLLTNCAILGEAVRLCASSDGPVTAVLVWNNLPRGPEDVTDKFRAEAEKRGFPVVTIPTN